MKPEWLTESEWELNSGKYLKLWKYHNNAIDMPEVIQKALITIEGEYCYQLAQLMSQKRFTSAFRENIYTQVLKWCELKVKGETPYNQPLSHKQMACISRPVWEFKKIESVAI